MSENIEKILNALSSDNDEEDGINSKMEVKMGLAFLKSISDEDLLKLIASEGNFMEQSKELKSEKFRNEVLSLEDQRYVKARTLSVLHKLIALLNKVWDVSD